MFRLHGLLVTSRPLVYTQPSRCLEKHRTLYAYRRAGAGGISLSADAFRDTPRVAARCVLVFLPEKPAAIVRSLPCAQALLPLVAGIPSENFSTRSLLARLFRGKLFSSCRCQGLHFGQAH